MTTILKPDICIIGAGSGGLTVAAACAAFGVPVVLVEKGRMGGDCLNYGCVPSKALLAAARCAQTMRHAGPFGIGAVEPEIDFRKVMRHVHSVIDSIAPNDSVERFTAMGVRIVQATARFNGRRSVVAGDYEIRARRFVIATGSSPAVPDIPGLSEISCLTSETIFERTRRPSHLVVVGGGPAGLELAQAHRRLGSAVTVIEAAGILSAEDPEIAGLLAERLHGEGVDIRTGRRIERIERRGRTGVRVHLSGGGENETVDGSHLLLAAGRTPNVAELDLDAARIAHTPSGITVSKAMRTSNSRVYAIGDVAGGPKFTHVANFHAGLVVRALLFRLRVDREAVAVPRVTYTDPELAHVGLTETEARPVVGRHLRILRWPFAENDRARAERETCGLVKIVTGRRGRILGVTLLGAGAGELIGLWSLALARNMRIHDMLDYVAPYPTMGEIGKRAALTYFMEAAARRPVRGLVGLLRRLG